MTALTDVSVVTIEHLGSTAVEDLAAKPVIDIDTVVTGDHVQERAERASGSALSGDRSLGIPHRWALREPAGTPRTNTFAVKADSLALRNHLAVRDLLRTDTAPREEYASLKRELASRLDDIDAYVEAKSALLSRILERSGLTDEERASIERANRASSATRLSRVPFEAA